jgi:DNA polymerase-3 subunit epsilon
MKRLIYDLETTGLNYEKHAIHQISGLIEVDGVVVDSFDFKVRPVPSKTIDEEALKVSGVDLHTVLHYPPAGEIFEKLTAILGKYVDKFNKQDKMFLCGFNSSFFDDKFLREFFTDNGDKYFGSWFWTGAHDVMILASYRLAHLRSGMANFQLKTVATTIGIEVDESKLHDATYDLWLTREIENRLQIWPSK